MNQFQSVGEIFAALRRRAWVIIGIFLVGCVISVDYALVQQKVYEATAVVQIEDARVSSTATATVSDANEASRRLQLIGFTDAVGFALLMPPVRQAILRYLRSRIRVQTFEYGTPRQPTEPDIIDGDYEEVTPPPKSPTHRPSGWTRH